MNAYVIFDEGTGDPVAVAVADDVEEVAQKLKIEFPTWSTNLDIWFAVPLLEVDEVEDFAREYYHNLGEKQEQFRIRGEQ